MSRRLALQMDPIGSINPKGDSTLRLGLEAQARGWELYYYTPDKLSLRDGNVTANGYPIKFFPGTERYYELGSAQRIDLKDIEVILLRQDPPFNMHYITTTYLLEMLPKTLVLNNPASVRNNPEKLFPAQFRQFAPPTLISSDVREFARFRDEHKDIVLKPLYGFGGHSVFRLTRSDNNFETLMETIGGKGEPWVAQPFLPEVKEGERRIILIDGEIGAVFGRLPPTGEIRSNMRVGGTPVAAELTPVQREICAALGPVLKEKGIMFAGVDVIGDKLIEINITSPTGLAAVTNLYSIKLEERIWDAIEARL